MCEMGIWEGMGDIDGLVNIDCMDRDVDRGWGI